MRRRLLVWFVVAYVGIMALAASGAHWTTSTQFDALDRRLDARTVTAAGFIEAYVRDVFRREQDLAHSRLRGDVDQASFARLVIEHGFDTAVLVDQHGKLLAVYPPNPARLGSDVAVRYRHLASAIAGRPSVSDIVQAAGDGRPVVGFAAPYDAGQIRHVFSGAYSIANTPLAPYMANVSSLSGSRSYLVDSRGEVVAYGAVAHEAAGGPPVTWPKDLAEVDAQLDREVAATTSEARSGSLVLDGTTSRWTAAAVEGTPWRVVTTVPRSTLYAPAAGAGRAVWLSVGVLALLGLGLLALAARDQARAARLERRERELRSVLDSTSDAVVGMDAAGAVTAWNAAAEGLFGWSAAEACGQSLRTLLVPKRHRRAFDRGVERVVAGRDRVSIAPMEVSGLTKAGDELDVELLVTGFPVEGDYLFRGFVRDIRPRRDAEAQVRMLASLVAATGDAIVSCDIAGAITSWNLGAERLYGFTEAEALGRPVAEVLPTPGDFESAELGGALRLVYDGRRIDALETTRLRKDGSRVRVSISMAPLTDPDGTMTGVVSSARDVSAAHEQARQLREAEERFRLAFDAVPTGMLLSSLDPDEPGRIVRANSAVSWMLGYTEAELQQRTFNDVTHPDDRETGAAAIAAFISGEERALRFEKRYVHANGEPVWAMVSAAAVQNRAGRPAYVVTQIEDITDRRREQDRLKTLALTDALTGLSNRLDFADRLGQALRRPGNPRITVGLIYCDLDGFKPVNDEFGHDAGDDLLRQVAHRLQAATRPSDLVARLGGDEFVVLCDDLPDRLTAERVATRVRETIQGTYLVPAGTVTIGASLGLATVDLATTTGVDAAALLKEADERMYADKRDRRAAPSPAPAESHAQL